MASKWLVVVDEGMEGSRFLIAAVYVKQNYVGWLLAGIVSFCLPFQGTLFQQHYTWNSSLKRSFCKHGVRVIKNSFIHIRNIHFSRALRHDMGLCNLQKVFTSCRFRSPVFAVLSYPLEHSLNSNRVNEWRCAWKGSLEKYRHGFNNSCCYL